MAAAQPSGGPYGPIRQTYPLPKEAGKVLYVAPDGQADQSGETLSRPTTLEAAIERVRTGDAIIMRGGTYRTGNLLLNQGITIQPYADEQPVLKGSFVASTWEKLGNGLWTTRWSHLFPSKPADWWRRNREGKHTPLYRFNNDMVFVDGRFLQAVGWEGEVDSLSYYIDYDAGLVYIGIDPTDRLVEITAFDVAILRTTRDCHGKKSDRKGYQIRGIMLSQYAYRALEIEGTDPEGLSDESRHGKEVVGTTLENCTISFCSRVAGYFRGDQLTIRRCRVSDTSTEGVYVIASNDVLLEHNIFMRNNVENITGYYPAAVKIFNQCYRVTCRDNLVIDLPHSNGIWYDVGNVDGVFVNNWIEGVGRTDRSISSSQLWPSDNGFFFEISKGALCAGNVFVNCDHGLMVLNSSSVQMYQNTFVNSVACIGRNARTAAGDHFGWHASTGPDIDKREGHAFVNNLLTADGNFDRPLRPATGAAAESSGSQCVRPGQRYRASPVDPLESGPRGALSGGFLVSRRSSKSLSAIFRRQPILSRLRWSSVQGEGAEKLPGAHSLSRIDIGDGYSGEDQHSAWPTREEWSIHRRVSADDRTGELIEQLERARLC
jgi:hypothetical protein